MINELQILIESLEKKCAVLETILSDSKEQEVLTKAEEFDVERFDLLVEHKDELLKCMDDLDLGFDSLFSKVKDELLANTKSYTTEIKKMQNLITTTVDFGAQISATEMRTKNELSNSINRQRQILSKRRVSSKSVMDYYKTSNQLNNLQPFFLDQKK